VSAEQYVLLSYARRHGLENGEHLMDGFITVRSNGYGLSEPVQGLTYRRMMTEVSKVLKEHPDHLLHIQRTDAPVSQAQQVPERDRMLLRDDPTAFINSTTLPSVVVMLGGSKPAPRDAVRLRTGLSSLADAFGEEAYLRSRSDSDGYTLLESPFSGRWCRSGEMNEVRVWLEDGTHTLPCRWQPRYFPHRTRPDQVFWAVARVEDLLKTDCARFFLPREWNTGGPWIPREDLQKKLNEFRAEKAQAEKEI
jgi:hypothetical protein